MVPFLRSGHMHILLIMQNTDYDVIDMDSPDPVYADIA